MKGKKSNPEFVSHFIQQCAQQGIETSDQILQHAKQQVQQIDQELIAIADKKILRCKLLDVIELFAEPQDRSADIRQLALFGNK